MLNMKEIVDYGPCYVLAINCPADGIDLPHKTTLFDVFDSATHETIDTFRTARQAKKFAHRYIADPEGTMQRQRMLSGDRLTHLRALWAVSLLSNWINYELTITDKRNPKVKPKQYEVSNIFVTAAENQIVILFYPDSEATIVDYLYLNGIKAVRVISENSFEFEDYQGKVYTIRGID
ncbi:hypothetical protein [uncultured Oscillibacter sp.]|uniref:hypothetical protein n=1 Tax=uncultured Oscillibacter sp. TaxID=876091 RepID=UPI00261B660F|nr:hypothetical protein [uncultured Oscillibacter sp.]